MIDFSHQLRQYLTDTLTDARRELEPWFNLEALNLSDVALATFYFIYKAIDSNETQAVAEDYLLLLPDAELAEEALQGALLGALLGKYRANYIASDTKVRPYSQGDVLLKERKDGGYEWYQVDAVDALGNVTRRIKAYPRAAGSGFTDPLSKAMRLLSRWQAKQFQLDKDYPTKVLRNNLITAIKQIRAFLRQAPLVSDYPHRMGVVCGRDTAAFVAETHPMPLRDWNTRNNPRMLLPLEPMTETARSYQSLEQNVFQHQSAYNAVEDLLIFDVRQYCDGNGRFEQIRQGRAQGYYRNLILVGSRAPYVAPGVEPASFRRWEWTPEELALLRGQHLRYPQIELITAPALAASHAAALEAWAVLEKEYRLDLTTLRRLLPLFYRLLLPPDATAESELARQLAGLRYWAEAQWSKQGVFSNALIYDPHLTRELSTRLSAPLTAVTDHLREHNGKYERLRTLLTPTEGPAPALVVLIANRRELEATETALRQALAPAEFRRLRLVDGSRLAHYLRDPALNQSQAVWVLTSLRVGSRQEQELSIYRRLLLARADVRLLAYEGIEQDRYAQIERLHLHLISQAIQHPDRSHFSRTTPPALVLPLVPPLPNAPEGPATPTPIETNSFEVVEEELEVALNDLFGDPGDGHLHVFEDNSPDKDGWGDETLSVPGQQCILHFTDQTSCQTAYGRPIEIVLRLPAGQMLGRRLPGTLLPGDEVLRLRPNGPRLMHYLRRQDPPAFAAIDAAAGCWIQALRRIYQHCGCQPTRLYQQLKTAGLRPSLATLERWLLPTSPLRFPRAKSSLRAIAHVEEKLFGSTAVLASQLPSVLTQRGRYNAAVRKEVNRNSLLLFDAYISGDSSMARQALGQELFHALGGSVQTHVLTRLELL